MNAKHERRRTERRTHAGQLERSRAAAAGRPRRYRGESAFSVPRSVFVLSSSFLVPRVAPHVIIVGAGVIGCACAFELASAGARVSVFDVRRVGLGASQASAGVLAPFIEGHDSGPLLELGRRSLDLYDHFVQRVTAPAG